MSIVRKKAGRIAPVLMGDYDNTTTYRRLDWVYYGGTSYICKKNNTVGIVPSNTERWQKIIELPTELNMIFTEAATRENISSGEKLSVILGKIKKCISDIKNVAFTANYNDLINTPNSLKNPNALNIKFNGTSQASYDGSAAKEVNVTPAGIGAVNTSTLLNTTEQISANTDANNITGALAAKAMMADYNNKINTINSNLTAQHFYLVRNPEHCTYDFSNCYRIGNIAVLSLYLDIRNIPQGYDRTLIATLPFKIKNAFPMETILSTGEGAIMYLENNGDTGVLQLNANGAAVDESAFLGQIVAVVE